MIITMETAMRLNTVFWLAFGAACIVLAGAALAAEPAAAPSTWADVEVALISLVLTVVGILGAIVLALRPVIVAAAAAWIEQATSARVARVDHAIDEALDAGASPEQAGAIVAAKLPATLQRSGKREMDIANEAEVKAAARINRPTRT